MDRAAEASSSAASGSPARAAALALSCASPEPPPTATAAAIQSGPIVSLLRAGVELGGEADQVAELADRLEVALGRQPLEPERVQVVAGQELQVGLGALEQPGLAVVQEVALADRLEEELVGLGRLGGARAGGGERAERRRPRRSRARGARSTSSLRSSSASWSRTAHLERLVERLGRGRERLLDRLVVVGQRREPGLELRRGRVDAPLEHRPAEAAVGLGVAGRGTGEVARRLGGEEDGDEPGHGGDADRVLAGRVAQPVREALGGRGEALVGGRVQLAAAWRAPRRRPAGSPRASPPGRRRRPGRSAASARPSRRRRRPAARRR